MVQLERLHDTLAPQILVLANQKPLAQGRQRRVYLHPLNPRRIIKVTRPEKAAENNRHLSRELAVYADLPLDVLEQPDFPLPRAYGTAQTDFGPSEVYEAIAPVGKRSVGPTLRALLRTGPVTPDLLTMLNTCLHALDAAAIPVTDVTGANLVLGERPGWRGFVLVDGFGDYRALPLARWLPAARRRRLRDGFARLAPALAAHWDEKAGQFRA